MSLIIFDFLLLPKLGLPASCEMRERDDEKSIFLCRSQIKSSEVKQRKVSHELLKMVFRKVFQKYNFYLEKAPLLTKCVTSGLLGMVTTRIQQINHALLSAITLLHILYDIEHRSTVYCLQHVLVCIMYV